MSRIASRIVIQSACLFVALCLGNSNAPAQTVSFSDATFNPGDWPLTVLSSPSPTSTGSAAQVFSGIPNPGLYQRITHVLGGTPTPSRVTTVHIHTPAVYVPGVQGAIQSVDYWEVASTLSTEPGTYGGGTGAALRQNGLLYIASTLVPIRDDPNARLPSPLKQIGMAGLSAGDFGRVLGAGMFDFSQNPDFSASGSPIEFGFARNNSHTSSSTVTRVTAIRSWGVAITPVSVPPPVISLQPRSLTQSAGSTALFTTVASSSGPTQFQWTWNGAPIPGATSPDLRLTNIQPLHAGSYAVTVSNVGGSVTSAAALLTVLLVAPPAIVASPVNRDVTAGADVRFCVTASGGSPLSYQWQKDGKDVPGAVQSCLMLTAVQAAAQGAYRVMVSNPAGSVISQAASLTVRSVRSTARRTLPATFVPANEFPVVVEIIPDTGVLAHAVEETPPGGWTVKQIDNNGIFDAINGKVKWGPFFDSQRRLLTYIAIPPAGAAGPVVFGGTASFDGAGVVTGGASGSAPVDIHLEPDRGDLLIRYAGSQLLEADDATGPFRAIPGATSPYRLPASKLRQHQFFKTMP